MELHTISSQLFYDRISRLLNWSTFICIKYQSWLSSVDAMGANDAREELRLCYLAWGINTGFLEEVTVNQRLLGHGIRQQQRLQPQSQQGAQGPGYWNFMSH